MTSLADLKPLGPEHGLGAGALIYREVEETGLAITLYPMMFNLRICVGPIGEPVYDNGWCYHRPWWQEAIDAAEVWDGTGIPPGGWYRDINTDERRTAYD